MNMVELKQLHKVTMQECIKIYCSSIFTKHYIMSSISFDSDDDICSISTDDGTTTPKSVGS